MPRLKLGLPALIILLIITGCVWITTGCQSTPTAPVSPIPTATRVAAPIISFEATPPWIEVGECTVLTWAVDGVTTVYLDGEAVGDHGSKQMCPDATTTCTLRAVGPGGERTADITVVVIIDTPASTPTDIPIAPPAVTATPPPTPIPTPTYTPVAPPPPPAPPPPTPIPTPTYTPIAPPAPTPGLCLPSVVDTIGLAGHPKGVAADGYRVYVGLHDIPKVAVINAATNIVSTYWDTGVSGYTHYANGVAFHPGWGRLYVANRGDNSVSSIDISVPSNVNVIPVGTQPFGLATVGQYVYVANFGDDRVGRIDTSTDNYFSLMDVFYQPALLASLGQHAFVPTNGPGPIYRIPPTGSRIAVGIPAEGYFAAAANANQRVFVTNRQTGEVTKINGNNNSVEDIVGMPHTPYGIAVNLLKNRVHVVAAEVDRLYVLDGATLQILGSVPVGAQGAAEGGQGIAVWGNKIYVSNYQASSLTVLDDSACP